MKKITIILGCACLISLTSCFKKERVCTCTSTYTSNNGTVTTSEPSTTTYKKIKSGNAKDQCVSGTYESSHTQGSNTTTSKSDVKCTLD